MARFEFEENEIGEVGCGLAGSGNEVDAETAMAWAAVTQVEVLRQIRDELKTISRRLRAKDR